MSDLTVVLIGLLLASVGANFFWACGGARSVAKKQFAVLRDRSLHDHVRLTLLHDAVAAQPPDVQAAINAHMDDAISGGAVYRAAAMHAVR